MFVFCINHQRKPLGLVPPKVAKQMLSCGDAAVFRHRPFIILCKKPCETFKQYLILKIDPGYEYTGLAIINKTDNSDVVLWAAQIKHHAKLIVSGMLSRRQLRSGRRSRKTRYRPARWRNRTRPDNWLPPSTESMISNIVTWAKRINNWCELKEIWCETNKFDPAKEINPEITGEQYQQGSLFGYRNEREWLLDKHGECADCGRSVVELNKLGIKIQKDHIKAKSKGGANSTRNYRLLCQECNQKRGNKYIGGQGQSLRAMSVMNQIRFKLPKILSEIGLTIELSIGKITAENRNAIFGDIKKIDPDNCHWIDAACVGNVHNLTTDLVQNVLIIKSMGHGTRQMCQTDKYGFPKQHRSHDKRKFGIATGDLVKNKVTGQIGTVVGARVSGSMGVKVGNNNSSNIVYKKLDVVQRADGYSYSFQAPRFFPLKKEAISADA